MNPRYSVSPLQSPQSAFSLWMLQMQELLWTVELLMVHVEGSISL